MINIGSWRRADAVPVPGASGDVHAAMTTVGASDAGAVTAVHLDPGGSTERQARPFGQLVIVVAGSGTVEVGNERRPIAVGDAVRWPRDVPHRLATSSGISVLVVTHEEGQRAWRVTRVAADGSRWVVGVFDDTDRAKAYRERVREELGPGEDVVLE